jgi:hypothetical protein
MTNYEGENTMGIRLNAALDGGGSVTLEFVGDWLRMPDEDVTYVRALVAMFDARSVPAEVRPAAVPEALAGPSPARRSAGRSKTKRAPTGDFACPHCSQRFSRKNGLSRHVGQSHKSAPPPGTNQPRTDGAVEAVPGPRSDPPHPVQPGPGPRVCRWRPVTQPADQEMTL